jgi:hypothetical protein
MITRFLTFLLHPTPLLALGFYDIIVVLIDIPKNKNWYNLFTWHWKKIFKTWSLSFGYLILMLIFSGDPLGDSFTLVKWSSLKGQLIQLIRPLYITRFWWEYSFPLVYLVFLTTMSFFYSYKSKGFIGLFTAGSFLTFLGVIFPRDIFWGGWEHGTRIVFLGLILLIASWSFAEKKLSKFIIVWIILAFSINICAGHIVWNLHKASSQRALNIIKTNFTGGVIKKEYLDTHNAPSIYLGNNIPLWSWSEGYIKDTVNWVGKHNWGPVKYKGISHKITNSKSNKSGILLYHPYTKFQKNKHKYKEVFMTDDLIYTIIIE